MVIVIAGQKGGAGKSTLAACLAAEGVERGQRVLLVDADPQGTARTWGEVAVEQGRPVPTIVAMGATMHRPDQLPRVAEGFDLVVVDCPPRAGDVQRAALMIASLALLPCGPSAPEAWALATSLDVVREAQVLRPDLRAAIVVTRRQRTVVGQSARDVLATSELPVLKTELGHRVAYQEAIAAGQGVTTYAPRSEAAVEVRALFDEVVEMLSDGGKRDGKRAKQGQKRAKRSG